MSPPFNESTLAKVRALVAEVCGVDAAQIRHDGTLRAYGLDSIRTFELLVALEDSFRIRIPEHGSSMLEGATVAELALQVEKLR